jgi:hypothetical protein
MALWTMTDSAAGMPKYANTSLNVTATNAQLFANTTASAIVTGEEIGVFGVSAGEMAYANTAGTEADIVPHSGWVIRTEGTGGRSGRVNYEVLVAASSITGDTVKDDAVLPE